MKIVVSIPVHERKDVIVDQIRNIQFYIETPIIILHVSKQFYEAENGDFSELEKKKNVFINPVHYSVCWGDIVHVHVSNFLFATKTVGNFDYFLMHASNDMYVRKGIEKYIFRYKAGFQRRLLEGKKSMWCPCEYAWKDSTLHLIMKKCGAAFPVGTQIEGSFFRKDVFEKVVSCIANVCFGEGEHYTREEIYFSTVAYQLIEERNIGYPTTFSEVHRYDRKLWKKERALYSFSTLFPVNCFLKGMRYEKIRGRMIDRFRKSNKYAVTKRDIRRIRIGKGISSRENEMQDYPGKYRLYDEGLFSVKRVQRRIDDPIRAYIRRKMYEDSMS